MAAPYLLRRCRRDMKARNEWMDGVPGPDGHATRIRKYMYISVEPLVLRIDPGAHRRTHRDRHTYVCIHAVHYTVTPYPHAPKMFQPRANLLKENSLFDSGARGSLDLALRCFAFFVSTFRVYVCICICVYVCVVREQCTEIVDWCSVYLS